jgi:riboflavin synthase
VSVDRTADGASLTVETHLARELGEGDSIAVNGVCLTAKGICGDRFGADVVLETLRRSSLDALRDGSKVNLELALKANARLGGHVMQGHVDGVGVITAITPDGFSQVVTVQPGGGLMRYIVGKGSIAVDGISLTVARADDETFDVALIPETLERTTLGTAMAGATVNLEVDVLAKYVEKLIAHRLPETTS